MQEIYAETFTGSMKTALLTSHARVHRYLVPAPRRIVPEESVEPTDAKQATVESANQEKPA